MKLIWTYSSKLNRSSQIKDEDMLSLYKTSIEYGSKYHFTRVYTDKNSKNFFEGLVDDVVVLPDEFEYYFLDDIKFYVMMTETNPFTLIDGDLFLYQVLPSFESDIVVVNNNRFIKDFYSEYNKLKQFYKENIEGVYFNRVDECVEMSLCTYFFSMYCMVNKISFTSYHKFISKTHLSGPYEKYKLEHIAKHKQKTLI